MSDSENPWQSPGTVIKAEENSMVQGGLTAVMLRYLKEASPWLRFLGVMGFIGAGFMAVFGVIAAIGFTAGASVLGTAVAGSFGALAGFIYIAAGVVGFFPARFTYRFGSKIRDYLLSHTEQDLEEALKSNRSLWKFNGILMIVSLAFIPVAIIGAVIAAITAVL
jgi:hypothetical protein